MVILKLVISCPICGNDIIRNLTNLDDDLYVHIMNFEQTIWFCEVCEIEWSIGDIEITDSLKGNN